MVRDKRDIRPVILKFGVALALSLGGILFTFFKTTRINPSNSSSSPNSGGKEGELKNDDQKKPASGNSVSEFPWKYEDVSIPKIVIGSSISGPSTNCRSGGDRDGLLLPELNELVKEFGSSPKGSFSPCKDVETPLQDADSPKEDKIVGRDDHEQEIENLKNIVKTLKERERTLEIQLLEYYGLKEQENSIRELQNRLKIHNLEAKHLGLKIECLKAEKMKLKAQVADSAKVVSDLEAARLKIKQLKKKLGLEADHNKEQILSLKERVMKLQVEEKNPVEAESDVQLELQKLKDLESEADELRKSNQSLRAENSTLAERLESVQILAISVMEDDVTEALKEESLRQRKQNEDLVKQVEQLQAGHSSHADELVYLQWINACLRYELRNYQPVPGKTTARDLSKTLSPKSKKKAKQLIREYADKEDQGNRGIHDLDLDSDQLSSQAPYLTNSGEFDGTSIDNSSAHKTDTSSKSKMFGKLMRLLRGKDHHHSQSSSEMVHSTEENAMVHSTEENAARGSNYSSGYSSDTAVIDTGAIRLQSRSSKSSQSSSKQFIDFHSFYPGSRSNKGESSNYLTRTRRYSDVGSLDYISKRLAESPQEKRNDHGPENVQKSELAKYAEVLKRSCSKAPVRKRSASVSFF
ncbi:protein CHUP1, chloroplastic-like [Solanum dulcamara]|uniref:protein CHUP1, chloroplastic-like n=1 Tax=Solanum dulcamara TaxID=45834 RepID=UPI00248594B6|nr:protein CHUP1, chloroplastic-like [Solanum dulcamara]